MNVFSYIGIGINFFLLILLFSKKGKTVADKILACWLLVIGCHLTLFALNLEPVTEKNIHWLMGTGIPFPFLHGPFLYLYTAAMTNMLPTNRKIVLLHFLPAIITTLFFLPVFLMSAPEKIAFMKSGAKGYEVSNTIRKTLIQLSGLVYVVWCLLLLRKHKRNIEREFSYEEKINLHWLRYFIYGLAAIWVIIVFFRDDHYIFAGVVLFIIFLGYFGIRQVGIFTNKGDVFNASIEAVNLQSDVIISPGSQHENCIKKQEYPNSIATAAEKIVFATPSEMEIVQSPPPKKYTGSRISEALSREIHSRLVELMDTKKIYTEPALSLSILAQQLAVHPNNLSQAINENEGKTFFEYVNTLRVGEFKRLVAMPTSRQFTMMSLAYDCGFNSKAAFYRNFKNLTGQTPTDYLHQQNIQMLVD